TQRYCNVVCQPPIKIRYLYFQEDDFAMKLSVLKRVLPLMLVVLGIVTMSLGAAGAQDDELTFAMVSHGGVGNPFWIVVIKGMEDACALLDANCQWLADPVDNVNDMAGYCDDALALEPDGIGVTSPNP